MVTALESEAYERGPIQCAWRLLLCGERSGWTCPTSECFLVYFPQSLTSRVAPHRTVRRSGWDLRMNPHPQCPLGRLGRVLPPLAVPTCGISGAQAAAVSLKYVGNNILAESSGECKDGGAQ